MRNNIVFKIDIREELSRILDELAPSQCVLIYPENNGHKLLPNILGIEQLSCAIHLPHPEGEQNKTIATATQLWSKMLEAGVNRKAVVINLGGGMTTDLGGFVAACYMRGVKYINIPTTLLAQVDASCGGKTGVNLDGVKNIIGAFAAPYATIISPRFFGTLPPEQSLSGWAEMLKHSLLMGKETASRYLELDPLSIPMIDMLILINESVNFKKRVTDIDPCESGYRRILNLGHTIGHALEAYYNEQGYTHGSESSLTHGHAVAYGTLAALVLSKMLLGCDANLMYRYANTIKRLYPPIPIKCDHYKKLLELMHHDKKNTDNNLVHFVLIGADDTPVEAYPVDDATIQNALDITRDLLGL
ncbi:MAG: 3-dehydroquinate synthase [Muribaculaceae bacterium]|nr:3-dehydroquinate synthase [Muribaculaceae bacterium]